MIGLNYPCLLQFGFVFYHDRTRHSFSKYFLMHIKKICKCIIYCIWKGLMLILKIVLHTIQELTLLGLEITKMNPIAITVTFHTVNKISYIAQGITLQINFFLFLSSKDLIFRNNSTLSDMRRFAAFAFLP